MLFCNKLWSYLHVFLISWCIWKSKIISHIRKIQSLSVTAYVITLNLVCVLIDAAANVRINHLCTRWAQSRYTVLRILLMVLLKYWHLVTCSSIPTFGPLCIMSDIFWHSDDRASWYIIRIKANEVHYFSNFTVSPCILIHWILYQLMQFYIQ